MQNYKKYLNNDSFLLFFRKILLSRACNFYFYIYLVIN